MSSSLASTGQEIPTAVVLGLRIAKFTLSDLLSYFEKELEGGKTSMRNPTLIAYINAHSCNIAFRNAAYREALDTFDLRYLDGNGPRFAAWLAGENLPPRLTGADWFPKLCDICEQRGFKIFLLGSRPGVSTSVANMLEISHPDLEVVGTQHGFFRVEDESTLIHEINRARPDLLILGMGSPKQELWMVQNRKKLNVPVIWGAGGVLDYVSGNTRRAPLWMRNLALEWLGRMIFEPRRLLPRYLIGIPGFIGYSILSAFRQRFLKEL